MASSLWLIVCFGLAFCQPSIMDYPMMVADQEAGIKLHRPDGTAFHINGRSIAMIREPLSSENGKAVVVLYSGSTQSTQETVQEVIDLLTSEGAH